MSRSFQHQSIRESLISLLLKSNLKWQETNIRAYSSCRFIHKNDQRCNYRKMLINGLGKQLLQIRSGWKSYSSRGYWINISCVARANDLTESTVLQWTKNLQHCDNHFNSSGDLKTINKDIKNLSDIL